MNIFYIDELNENYCIVYTKNNIEFFTSTYFMITELNITYENYINILIKHGADYDGNFKSKNDIEECIEELETYEIMNKLCE